MRALSRFWQCSLDDEGWIQGWRKAKWVERLLRASGSLTSSRSTNSRAICSWLPPRHDGLLARTLRRSTATGAIVLVRIGRRAPRWAAQTLTMIVGLLWLYCGPDCE